MPENAYATKTAQVTESTVQGPSKLLWAVFLCYFTFGMITNVLGVIIPVVIQQYHLSMFAAGFLAFSFFLAYGVASIPTGLLMDRLGAKPLVVMGLALMCLGCCVIARANSYPLMLIMTFCVGLGVTILQTAGNPLVQHLDRPQNYHRNLTLTIGFCGIGAFLGPFILSAVRGLGYQWQTLYMLFALLSVALLLLLAVSRFPAIGTGGDGFRTGQLWTLLRTPLMLFYALGIFFYVGSEVGTASWIMKFFERVHGLSSEVSQAAGGSLLTRMWPTLPAIVVALFWGAQGAGRLISGSVLNTFGSRRILRIYSFFAFASLLAANFGPKNVAAVAFVACGFFTSVMFTLIFSGTIASFADSHGTISGLLCTAILGGALLPPLVGWVGDNFGMHGAMLVPTMGFAYVLGLAIFGRAKYD